MIDLHIHSTFSDGTDTVEQIVEKANSLGVTHMSITDHNKCEAHLDENKHLFKNFKGKAINGVEISTYFDGQIIHVLAYDFNISIVNKFLKKNFEKIKHLTAQELQIIGEKLDELKIYNKKPTQEILNSNIWSINHYYPFIMTEQNIKEFFNGSKLSVNEVFWEYITNKNSPLFCDFKDLRPGIEEVIEVIKNAGGKCFVAHSYSYGEHFLGKLDTLKQLGIDGFECYYPTYTKEQTAYLANYCDNNNLLKSAGSDYHGTNRENQMVTGINNNLNKDFLVIKNWNLQ